MVDVDSNHAIMALDLLASLSNRARTLVVAEVVVRPSSCGRTPWLRYHKCAGMPTSGHARCLIMHCTRDHPCSCCLPAVRHAICHVP